MESAIALRILFQPVTLFIKLTTASKIALSILCKVILINKIISRVIGRVNVDHLDLAQIGFLQQLQHIQVVSLDIQILGIRYPPGMHSEPSRFTPPSTGRSVAAIGAFAASIAFFLSGQVN